MNKSTEVWVNGSKWRTITTHPPGEIQYAWGKFDKPVTYFVRNLGSLRAAMSGAPGSGSELWYRNLSDIGFDFKLKNIRHTAKKAGYVNLGTI